MSRGPDGRTVPGEPQDDSHRHPYQLMVPPGSDEPVQIDTALVPLITALWTAGFETITCCQDLGESVGELSPRKVAYWTGWALVELPFADAGMLAELAAAHGFPMHWTEQGAWEMSAPMLMLGARALVPDLVQVRFPAAQLDELTALVASRGRLYREER